MKTSEMIAMLEKKPKMRFKETNPLHSEPHIAGINNNVLCWDGDTKFPLILNFGNEYEHDWQLVREPVPWQEAIQAYIDGKEVECVCEDCARCTVKDTKCVFEEEMNICTYGLKHGRWHIKGAE